MKSPMINLMTSFEPFLVSALAIFIRTSTVLMLLPAFSAAQIPMRARLFLAVALGVAILFALGPLPQLSPEHFSMDGAGLAFLVGGEMLAAVMIALPIRFLFLALGFAGEVTTQLIGLNAMPGMPIGDDQPSTTLSSLLNMAAVTLFFASGAHLHVIFALAASFEALPPLKLVSFSGLTEGLSHDLAAFFKIVLRLAAPLLIYSMIVNLIAGLTNKLTPQIPIYFVSTPFLIFGGLFILFVIGDDIIYLFNVELLLLLERM